MSISFISGRESCTDNSDLIAAIYMDIEDVFGFHRKQVISCFSQLCFVLLGRNEANRGSVTLMQKVRRTLRQARGAALRKDLDFGFPE